MSPRTLRNSLRLFPFVVTLSHSSIEFFIGQAFDECSRESETMTCRNNTDRGGLCAYAPDVNKLWCCPAPDPTCWRRGQECNGGSSAAPGPGQISCSSEGAKWCCNQEYERCTQKKNQIKVCYTVFASGNANVSIAEANTVESSSTSTSTTSSATPLGSVSWTLSSKANAGSASTTSATIPLDTDSSSSTTSSTTTSTPQPTSATPAASRPSSALSAGAIAGIVIGVLLAMALGFLLCWSIIRARRRPTHEEQPIISTNKHILSEMGDHIAKSELDGRRPEREMPAQEMRHEML